MTIVHLAAPPTRFDGIQVDVLHLLVVGATRTIVADMLQLSPRTVDQHTAEIRKAFRTQRRLRVGVLAVRNGCVDPQHPISYALGRRPGSDWVGPTIRQLAGGAAITEVAREIGLSTRTVRRDVAQLATANGARGDFAAGALFEALKWI